MTQHQCRRNPSAGFSALNWHWYWVIRISSFVNRHWPTQFERGNSPRANHFQPPENLAAHPASRFVFSVAELHLDPKADTLFIDREKSTILLVRTAHVAFFRPDRRN